MRVYLFNCYLKGVEPLKLSFFAVIIFCALNNLLIPLDSLENLKNVFK
jgi:hypothetical protein